MKEDFADAVKFRILRKEMIQMSGWTWCQHRVLVRGRQRVRRREGEMRREAGDRVMRFEGEVGATSPARLTVSRRGQREGNRFCPETPKGLWPAGP